MFLWDGTDMWRKIGSSLQRSLSSPVSFAWTYIHTAFLHKSEGLWFESFDSIFEICIKFCCLWMRWRRTITYSVLSSYDPKRCSFDLPNKEYSLSVLNLKHSQKQTFIKITLLVKLIVEFVPCNSECLRIFNLSAAAVDN